MDRKASYTPAPIQILLNRFTQLGHLRYSLWEQTTKVATAGTFENNVGQKSIDNS